jgi:hypothetical protein
MVFIDEYRGVTYSIPHNDDGVWHYKISPKRDRRSTARGQPQAPTAEGYPSREMAIQAARRAIDLWLVPA